MIDFATEWLAGLYGAEIKKSIGRTHATRWDAQRWALGAWSAAVPGGEGARRILSEPLNDVIWFAGEAAHETWWGTVGAGDSGERTADAVLRKIGALKEATPAATSALPKSKTKSRRGHVEQRVRALSRAGGCDLMGCRISWVRSGADAIWD